VFAWLGILIAFKRSCHTYCVALYGILLFFIVALPLLVEGTLIVEIGKINNRDL